MLSWLKRLLPRSNSAIVPQRRKWAHSRWIVEALEDRVLLTAYSFTEIAHSSGMLLPFDRGNEPPAVNNIGLVAFSAKRNADGSEGIFTGDGGAVTTIVDDSGQFNYFQHPSISDAGVVAFNAQHDIAGDFGVYTGSGGSLTTIVEAIGSNSTFYLPYSFPSLNNNGALAFFVGRNPAGGGPTLPEIVVYSQGNITTVADTSGPFAGFDANSVAINDSGSVAFDAHLDVFAQDSIVAYDRGVLTTIATSDPANATGFIDIGLGMLSLNNNGTVSFQASVPSGNRIVTSSNGTLNTLAEANVSGVPFRTLAYTSVNDSGVVAFYGVMGADLSVRGIFTGPDPSCQKVIQSGETLAGRTVLRLDMGPEALNNSGQIAFQADFTDGTSGVYRANPVSGNSPPIAHAIAPGLASYHVAAGGAVSLGAEFTRDCEEDKSLLLYEWDFDGDGQYDDATGITPRFSAAALNPNSTVTVGLRVTDSGGLSSTDTATVIIDPPSPGIRNFSATSPILVSQSTMLTGTITIDTSVSGAAKVAVTWGDRKKGKLKVTAETTALNLLHQYKLPGTFTITATLTRKKAVVATIMTTVTVQPSAV